MANRRNRPGPDDVLATINPKPARRWFAVGTTGLLGLILVYIAAAFPPADLAWLAFLVALGAICLWWAWRVWTATAVTLELTRNELRERGGRQLCAVENIDRIDGSAFAFKPAAGFVIHLREPGTRVYAPGLWWRSGRRVAVGGATARAEGKAVAELLNVILAERERG
ncbi:hypothetical protein N8I71_10085 [Roseibacterium sp. SDUM158016]|uniref:hypothetical protein n=1 Tax=Roseicyclus sediminis TaxID=2980997 RepID=UPI0021CE6445|nr:hypothetical protein [Roseibacterium sp. SDUM158016]MCU4653182.1 hypothetical protein [Roseibacterium sp. SDUM158016]